MALRRHLTAFSWLAAGSWISAVPLGLLQRNDDDVSAGHGIADLPVAAEAWDAWKRIPFDYEGMRYIGSFAPCLCINTRRPGSIFAGSAINMRIIFRIP